LLPAAELPVAKIPETIVPVLPPKVPIIKPNAEAIETEEANKVIEEAEAKVSAPESVSETTAEEPIVEENSNSSSVPISEPETHAKEDGPKIVIKPEPK
jgi:hypothetical protein